MFYHQVLLKRSGKFGIIWMEATMSSPYRITKRQALQVNVRQSCLHIMDIVCGRAREPNGKRTKFSLYLSAHLMYGIVSIWKKQVQILLADAQEISRRVKTEITLQEVIDLPHVARLDQINLPDAISKVAANDPLFGSFKRFEEDWEAFLQGTIYPEAPSPVLSMSPPGDRQIVTGGPAAFEPEYGTPHTVSSKAEITLRELAVSTSPYLEVPIPGEMDIPMLNGQNMEMMEQQEDETALALQELFPEAQFTTLGMSPPAPEAQLSPIRGDKTPEKAKTKKVDGRPKGEKKRRKGKEDLDHTKTEEPPHPTRPAGEDDIILEPLVLGVGRQRSRPRRQLFVDTQLQFTKAEIRQNFITTGEICREFVIAPTSLKDTPARLLKTPGSQSLARNSTLRRLWERNCMIKKSNLDMEINWDFAVDSAQEGRRAFQRVRREDRNVDEDGLYDEEGVLPHVGHPMEGITEGLEEAVTEVPSMETVREASLTSRTPQHSSLHTPRLGQSPLEESGLDLTGTRVQADQSRESARRTGSVEGASISSLEAETSMPMAGSRLAMLPEEIEEMHQSPPLMYPLPEEMLSPEVRFIRQCKDKAEKYTTFRAICPPAMNSRPSATKQFLVLLECCAKRELFVRQHRPYGDIYISNDPRNLPLSPR